VISREDRTLPEDQSPRPPSSSPAQPTDKPPELPRLHFPQRPDGQGPAPAPGGYPPPPPAGWGAPAPPPGNGHGTLPGNGQGAGQGAPPGNVPGAPGPMPGAPPGPVPGWGNMPPPGQPGGPSVRPPRPPRPARPTRPADVAVRQRAHIALLLGALSLIALVGIGSNFHRGVYLVIFALVVGLAACWLGVTAVRRARRSASMRPVSAMIAVVVGALGVVLSAVLLIALAVFWQQLTTYSRCLGAANTVSAQQTCTNQLNRSLNGEIPGLGASS
jgi:hypothetical protein